MLMKKEKINAQNLQQKVGLEMHYPSNRDSLVKSSETWLEGKRIDDNLGEGNSQLWRVHNSLYNLNDFIHKHPGGSDFIERTIGTDITEAFEASHPVIKPCNIDLILKKYFVKNIQSRRATAFTFHENGFYKTLKRRVLPILKDVGTGPSSSILLLQNVLIFLFFSTLFVMAFTQSYMISVLCGIFLGMLHVMSHNFYHQKPSWRAFVWDLSMLSSRDWRISHCISHHLYTSTYYDVELAALEPFLIFPPMFQKTFIQKYLGPFYSIIFYSLVHYIEYIKKISFILLGKVRFYPENLLPLGELFLITILNGSLAKSIELWLLIHMMSSLWLTILPQIGTHRHPESYHPGETPSKVSIKNNLDWGAHQLDIGFDVTGKSDWYILKMTSFGDHRLHHLFPTIDQSKLHYLYPIVEETCKEFGIPFETRSAWNMFVGYFSLFWKTTPREQ